MKSKRQTIWLVSMLSLMVVLSAYYLFTEDTAPTAPKVADGKQVSTTNSAEAEGQNTTADDQALSEGDIIVSEVIVEEAGEDEGGGEKGLVSEDQSGQSTDEASASKEPAVEGSIADETVDSVQKNDQVKAADPAAEDPKDEDVLKKLESQGFSAADSLTAYQMDRAEQNIKKQEQLIQTINDEKKPLDESMMASQQLSALEEKEEKITDIEQRLQQQYANAVVAEDNDSYRVVVISEKLQVKDAVSIIDMVMKELDVPQDKVKVQYVSQ
ncbi:SpoIIIAH-like family protein [Paenibacillus fonticola]|uniref:SpoIIIAH-like family protein n=1 Tax=Paenibacillus fonticola TaxID=379896 RepID=UPI000372BC07|nr:SpoIIIAH-like family protein [Paenibacillus fonticola]